ncbi:MAG: hypothetical protein IPK83_18025 [Planctomycetes bacterium]|nr:hypothetical protein [Planctomycetota bacterium]
MLRLRAQLQINWPRACTPGVCPAAPNIGDVVTVSQDCMVGGVGFPDAVAGTLNHTAGTLTVAGNLAIDTGGATFDGPVVLLNGSIARAQSAGVFMTLNGGMNISGGSDKFLGGNTARLLGALTLSSESTITWTGAGNFIVGVAPGGSPSTLYINSGTLFDQQTDASLLTTQQFGFGRVTNQGTIQKSAGNGTSTWNINLENFGQFDVQSGNVTLTGLGQATGEFRVAAGSALTFGTIFGFEFKQGISFTGDGEAVLVDTGSNFGVLVNETVDLNRLRIANSGEIGPASNPGHINITELLEVDGANVVPSVTINAGARLEQNGPNASNFRDLTIEGDVDILSGTLATVDHTITVQPGGVVEIRDNAALRTAGLVALPIQNNGTIQKTTGAGTASVLADFFRQFFNNAGGLVHVATGTLDFADSNIVCNGGTFQIDAGTTMKAPGSFGGNFELNAGAVRGGGSLLVHRLNNNGGTVAPGASAGVLSLIGDAGSGRPGDYLQGADGTLEIEVGGLTAGTQHDQLAVAGTATLGGRIEAHFDKRLRSGARR